MHVIIHPGFHKTGTSTLQAALRSNRDKLEPDIQIILSEDMPGLTGATKGYSVGKAALDLGLVIYEAAQIAEHINPEVQTVIISSESLCGQIPGRNGVKDYCAASKLLTTISVAFNEVLPASKLSFFFSTRSPQTWLASCYTQHLRASRMTLSADAYMTTFKPSSKLEHVIAECADALPPGKVFTARIEDSAKTRLGLLDSLLDIAGYPTPRRDRLLSVPNVNKAPSPALVAALLGVNRSDLNDKDARTARMKLNKGMT